MKNYWNGALELVNDFSDFKISKDDEGWERKVFKMLRTINSQEALDLLGKIKTGVLGKQGMEVVEVFKNSPAADAGIQAGWSILTVDGRTVVGLSSKKVASLIKGPVGTTVKLGVKRTPDAELKQKILTNRLKKLFRF